jgi:hypothetical protein
MNSNDAEIGAMVARVIRHGFRDVHDNIRKLISGMDGRALNWRPHPEANSIAVLVAHALGSEREMLAAVRGISVPRDRPSEFMTMADGSQLEHLIDQADVWLNQQTRSLPTEDLTVNRPRGDRPPQPGLVWLITNYGHAREHLAQMELTKQLYSSSRE